MDIFIKIGFDILAYSCIMILIVSGLAIIASLMGIFNLGHGFRPDIDHVKVKYVVEWIKNANWKR